MAERGAAADQVLSTECSVFEEKVTKLESRLYIAAPGSPAMIPMFLVFNLLVFIPLTAISLISISLLRAVVVVRIPGHINTPPSPPPPWSYDYGHV